MPRALIGILICASITASSRAGDDADKQADLAAYPIRREVKVGSGTILVKAPRGGQLGTVRKTCGLISKILADADPAIVDRIGNSHLEVILAPSTARFTDLPDLHDLVRFRNAFGQPLDLARGIYRTAEPPHSKSTRPTRNSPLIAVGEEDILRIIPCGPQSVFHHEFAHAIHDLGLSPEQRNGWRDEFASARRKGLFKNRYATLSEGEFFAELSQAYFDVTPYFCSKTQLAQVDRPAFLRLMAIYSFRRSKS